MVHSNVEYLGGDGRVVYESGKGRDIKAFSSPSFHCCFFVGIHIHRDMKISCMPVNERCRRQGMKLGAFIEWWVQSVCLYT